MKLFTSKQIREIDRYTIRNEPVTSLDLMERAAFQLFKWLIEHYGRHLRILIFTGPGNNGGDGLALGRMLAGHGYKTEIYNVSSGGKTSEEWEVNSRRLAISKNADFHTLKMIDDFPHFNKEDIIIDAIFGSGLSRPVEGLPAELIKFINNHKAEVISVDIPSGLFCEDNASNHYETIIKADHTLTFQFPKLSFLFSENHQFTGSWHVLPIGLHPQAIRETDSPFSMIESSDVLPLLKTRSRFDHKGLYGHGLLAAGSYGKMGAAVLSAKAALRAGIGLITCYVPSCGYQVLQTSVNEAMVITDPSEKLLTGIPDPGPFSAIGTGPGIGTGPATQEAIHKLIVNCRIPLVVDADGLNILSVNKDWLRYLPPGTVITPHPKEFERLAGVSPDGYSRLMKQIEFAETYNCVVILKGAHTSVATPDGKIFFNSTGNPGMATAGSGDVLTGIILSLLAQGYSPGDAAVCGVFLHGLAGDQAAGIKGFEAVIASDIIDNIGSAYNNIRNHGV